MCMTLFKNTFSFQNKKLTINQKLLFVLFLYHIRTIFSNNKKKKKTSTNEAIFTLKNIYKMHNLSTNLSAANQFVC